ncbi:MAG: hypothetical protein KDA86_02740 [Planctomycetaceae bacterium]|nr:hypothetical protein [Planctomycetaceae bacterium]
MQVHTSKGRFELPERMRTQLDAFRRRLWWIKVGEGLLAGLFGLLLSYVALFVIDRFIETPAIVRTILLLAGTLGLAVAFPLKWHRWVWRTRQLEQVAKLLRRRYPRLGDQLLGIVELAHAEGNTKGYSESLLRAAVAQVDEETSHQNFDEAVPNTGLRRWGFAAGGLVALVALVLALTPAAGLNTMARWLMPLSDTERYTFAQLDELPDKLVVPYAEEFAFQAKLRDETEWRPGKGSAQYGSQPPVTTELSEGAYDFTLPPQKESHSLKLAIGDARREIAIEPTMRPELTDMHVHITLPEYLQYTHELKQDLRGGKASLVKGSLVQLVATASRELAAATLDGTPQAIDGSTISSERHLVHESLAPELRWQDEFGLEGKQPLVLDLQATDDEPPTLSCAGGAFEHVLLESDVLTFQVKSTDDFGVKTIGMMWEGIEDPIHNPHPSNGEKVLLNGEPESVDLGSDVTFSAKREGIPPQTLKLRMFAVDYLPDRERVYSPTFVLHILSPEDHNIWLTRQLSKWFRTANEVYDKERQLHQTNASLQAMTAEELDRPETRKLIRSQASAERANGQRLGAVSRAGEGLIREAMKNDQFNPETLETWAEMLNALDDIAKKRMPSVSDLLTAAADGPAAKTTPSAKPPEPGESKSEASPSVGNNRNPASGKGGQQKTEGEAPRTPKVVDTESGFNEIKTPEEEEEEDQPPSPASASPLRLPGTTLVGGGPTPEKKPPKTPPEEQVAQAVEEQQELLDEFARVADELQRILDNLEGSTFVKRLKAASRRQMEVAGDMSTGLLDNFGVEARDVGEKASTHADNIANREQAQSDLIWNVQSDLEAYYQRVRDGKFKVVLDEMEQENPVGGISELGKTVRNNRTGRAIAGAEYWADNLDRWAEQLVGPACACNGQCPPGKADSLPPAVVLAVMKILEQEINLREETRAAEQARPTLEPAVHAERSTGLAVTQNEIGDQVVEAVDTIGALENAASFGREISLLNRVEIVMREAADLLGDAETGAPTIAAETEAIELLLQTKRINPKGGGGGGATPGGGGTGDTEESALALLGDGNEQNAQAVDRTTGQATGVSGRQFPAEYRTGLDAYFGAIEGTRNLNTESSP